MITWLGIMLLVVIIVLILRSNWLYMDKLNKEIKELKEEIKNLKENSLQNSIKLAFDELKTNA